MKMILKHILNTSALLLTGIVFAGCSSSDAPIEQPINPTGKYTMTVNASKGDNATTRALFFDGTALNVKWTAGEEVAVYKSDWSSKLGTLSAAASSNGKTTLSGDLTTAPAVNDNLYLLFPRDTWDYTGQAGVLLTADDATNAIEKKYDYALADVTVNGVDAMKISTTDASFSSQQAIVKFSLRDSYGFPINANSLTVSSGSNKIVQKIEQGTATYDALTIEPASATSKLYAAIRHDIASGDNITLTAVENNHDTYVYQKSGVNFNPGSYYTVNVTMKSAMLSEPLTLEAVGNNTQITFTNYSGGNIEYRINDGSWTSTTNFDESVSAGTKVSFRGNNSSYYPDDYASSIACTAPCYVYGNIMSLVDATNFATTTSLTAEHTFHSLFQGNTNIINHPSKDLLLPATTLKNYCYHAMFFGCTGLTRAPVLPAPSLVSYCYHAMFSGCSNLAYIKCLATSISATSCTTDWVQGVTKTEGTFVKATSANWSTGNNGIPSTSPPWTVTSE